MLKSKKKYLEKLPAFQLLYSAKDKIRSEFKCPQNHLKSPVRKKWQNFYKAENNMDSNFNFNNNHQFWKRFPQPNIFIYISHR